MKSKVVVIFAWLVVDFVLANISKESGKLTCELFYNVFFKFYHLVEGRDYGCTFSTVSYIGFITIFVNTIINVVINVKYELLKLLGIQRHSSLSFLLLQQ